MARATGAIFLRARKLKPLNYYEQIVRMNGKDDKATWQIIKELQPKINPAIAKLPVLMLDWLGPDYATRDELLIRGYDLPCYPLSQICRATSNCRVGLAPAQTMAGLPHRICLVG